jgi:hypothetical protein
MKRLSAAMLAICTLMLHPKLNAQSITQIASLPEPAMGHSATLLADGKVLVASPSGRSDLFVPGPDTWSQSGSMLQGSYDHTAVRLQNGKVLVVGGYTRSALPDSIGNYTVTGTLARTELFDPATQLWTASGALSQARVGHTLTMLLSGNSIAIGGATNAANSAATVSDLVEQYSPASGTWTSLTALPSARRLHTTTLLSDGRLLILGGYDSSGAATNSCWLFNLSTNLFTMCATQLFARAGHSATLLSDGKVFVDGGASPVTAAATIYDPASNTWSNANAAETAAVGNRSQIERNANSVVSVIGAAYESYTLGNPTDIFSAKVRRYFTGTNEAVTVGSIGLAAPTLTQLNDGRVLAVGGYDGYLSYCSLGCFQHPSPTARVYVIDKSVVTLSLPLDRGATPFSPETGERYRVPFVLSPPAVIPPTGTVTVSDGSASCSANVTTGECALRTVVPGPKSYSFSYSGDSEFKAAQAISARPMGDMLRIERMGDRSFGSLSFNPFLGFVWGCNIGPATVFVSACDIEFGTQSSVAISATANAPAGGSFVGWQGACAGTRTICNVSKPASGSVVVRAVFAPTASLPLKLDIDANGVVDAATDGQLIRRFMSRVHDGALAQSALGANPQRSSPDDIENRLNMMTPLLDVDQNGRADPNTDGVMILRFLLGFRDGSLTQNAIGQGARRTDASEIAAHLQALMP